MKLQFSADGSFSDSSESGDEKMYQGQGYRVIHLGRFSSTHSEAHVCEEGERCSWNYEYQNYSCTRVA